MSETARCAICGETMPPGEEMFNYHGYSGRCPAPPLPKPVPPKTYTQADLTRLYDILAGINDKVERGDDGYARFGCEGDADQLQELVSELEPAALAYHGERGPPQTEATEVK